jgi:hypothetical protein
MDEKIFPSKIGTLTASCGTVSLHSLYDPIKEAERYVESLEIKNDTTCFILLEPALSYIIPVLRKKNHDIHIIVLRCSSFFVGKENADDEWLYGSSENIQSFLERCIQDEHISYAKIIEWRPSFDAYGETYTFLLEGIRTFMKRSVANIITAKVFGPRWVKNCLQNLSMLKKVLTFKMGTCPVIVCGAGPSLETSFPLIKQFQQRQNVFIVAVSSAFLALKEYGINPHLVIGSDGGNWARFHFAECVRDFPPEHFFCAALNAALPSQCNDQAVLMLGDMSAWQSLLLEKMFVPHLRFPQRGSVTAAALDLAFQLTSGNVFVSGIDLSENDLLTHARPYAFDEMIRVKSNRFHPYYSEMFKRKKNTASNALDIYADWFYQYVEKYLGRIFSLGKNHTCFPSFEEEVVSVSSAQNQFPEFFVVSLQKQHESSLEILLGIIKHKDTNNAARKELVELLSIDDEQDDINVKIKEKLHYG